MNGAPFLSAEWRDLLIVNYEVAPDRLRPFVPAGTALDLFEGKALVSLVGFRFLHTRVRGVPVPGHTDFEEMNLRFYVTRTLPTGELRRGVVFLGEIVPRRAIAWVARTVYGEPYRALAMRHAITRDRVRYECRAEGRWHTLEASLGPEPRPATDEPGTAFITEHYWGYTRRSATRTDEYEVRHPVWMIRSATLGAGDFDIGAIYGPEHADLLPSRLHSACFALGSAVEVLPGSPLKVP
ncbi:MAG TPA: DUF2071 domain-containing protein [Gemmatimonadales bacterium]|nr:DUF2071 domain-containing protein [Gemmatimonadales bacterium]